MSFSGDRPTIGSETTPSRSDIGEERKAEIAQTIPLGRLGEAADACVYLPSDLSSCCNGITLDANGGMLIHRGCDDMRPPAAIGRLPIGRVRGRGQRVARGEHR